jgi:hypothetical protein
LSWFPCLLAGLTLMPYAPSLGVLWKVGVTHQSIEVQRSNFFTSNHSTRRKDRKDTKTLQRSLKATLVWTWSCHGVGKNTRLTQPETIAYSIRICFAQITRVCFPKVWSGTIIPCVKIVDLFVTLDRKFKDSFVSTTVG